MERTAHTPRAHVSRLGPAKDRESSVSSHPNKAHSEIHRTSKRHTHAPNNQFPDQCEFVLRAHAGIHPVRLRPPAKEMTASLPTQDLLSRPSREPANFSCAAQTWDQAVKDRSNQKMFALDPLQKPPLRLRSLLR